MLLNKSPELSTAKSLASFGAAVTRPCLLLKITDDMLFACGKAEAQIAAPIDWGVGVSIRHSAALRIVAPTATTDHAVRARCRVRLAAATVAAVPVLTPLPNVAAHIVDSKFIWCLCTNLMGLASTIVNVPSHITDIVASAVLVSPALVSTSCSVFPLCFGRKPEILTCFLIELSDKFLGVIPTNFFNR